MEFQARKQNGELTYADDEIAAQQAFLETCPDDAWFAVNIEIAKEPKSPEQLGYYYRVVLPVVKKALIDQGYADYPFDIPHAIDTGQADTLLKYFCAREDPERNIVIYDAKNHPDYPVRRKRDMNKRQLSQFTDNAIQWANVVLRCRIPEAVTHE